MCSALLGMRYSFVRIRPIFRALDLCTDKLVLSCNIPSTPVRNAAHSASFNKVFCIGLHKTGTRSLHSLFKSLGMRSRHDTMWDKAVLPMHVYRHYHCFSDGGAHFWDDHLEFGGNHRIRLFDHCFPNSKFILNTRELGSWLVSKMIHAGWTPDTTLINDLAGKLKHGHWRRKSIDVIVGWIKNRKKYHQKVLDYFKDRPHDLMVLDFASDEKAVEKTLCFLGITDERSSKPWKGKSTKTVHRQYYEEIVKKALERLHLPESILKERL